MTMTREQVKRLLACAEQSELDERVLKEAAPDLARALLAALDDLDAVKANATFWENRENIAATARAEAAETALAAMTEREGVDAVLLLAAYRGMLVLHRMCDKSGLAAGAAAAENIADQIVAAHPEMPGRASLRAALQHKDANNG